MSNPASSIGFALGNPSNLWHSRNYKKTAMEPSLTTLFCDNFISIFKGGKTSSLTEVGTGIDSDTFSFVVIHMAV